MPQIAASKPLVMEGNPEAAAAEEFRSLRTRIEYAAEESGEKVFAFVSALAGEGRSTVAANMAVAFAQAGKQTVLVDADLRRPALHRMLRSAQERGLGDYLTVRATEPLEIVHKLHVPNLLLVPAGEGVRPPADLLASSRLEELLLALKYQYDIVLIDTPPLLQGTDAQIVAAQADGAVLVVERGRVHQEQARQAADALSAVKARLFGVIFNRRRRR
ncbi:CpsD/CapB family tyrosine-protein kinase [Paenibacillus sp. IB182496]|uniref:CpsD/CapB family tyrosine-protein kinase n=1 Tax=Paenibacillus sabuli TaxID=2772509 RepID=A0A927GU76_9BACL|nr:CpsD/CapB family tyrosine-protein kinase [Paenibacillus sabuli]MBD2848639.1 CpsD/CapB family tyrosine-protein kinase [Paenibacillus sabuli]